MQASDTYFYFDGTNVVGPYSGNEISDMFRKGTLNEQTQICSSKDADWRPLSTFLLLMPSQEKPPKLPKQDTSKNGPTKILPLLILGLFLVGGALFIAEQNTKTRGLSRDEFNQRMESVRESIREKENNRQMEIENAIINKKLMAGMTRSQVLRAWGSPNKKESDLVSGKRFEWWYYDKNEPSIVSFVDMGDGEEPKILSDPYK